MRKNGHRGGKQNYRCQECDRQFLASYSQRGYSNDAKQICLKMYGLGLDLREIERLTGISHSTVHKWIEQANVLSSEQEDTNSK
ncbi:transposase-like zinc-binding domain-containing protein [Argonema antarcticum]|uniref:IS1/IS1595 family N-terminal zinc-binding domain-containing protein n=1 Tax=Argonema antarcticum TaxID=2942763 RepID=UPI002012299F|nr:hypothetical protein [Argonema antarcticum]MCL1472223.1 hypothetical protein [Argonema antarcticum A004/B2]